MRFFREVVLTDKRGPDDPCLIWPFARGDNGYGHLWQDGKTQLVARLVCKEMHGEAPSPDHEAAHSCGRGKDGCITNGHLSWKTHVENEADKLVHGTRLAGATHPLTKLTDDDVREIRALANVPDRQIAERFDISKDYVAGIQRRERRRNVI